MATMEKDFQAENWWEATTSGSDPSWTDDYTRHRDGTLTYSGTTYSGVTDMYNHSGDNQPADTKIGRIKTGLELDKGKY